MSRRNRREFLEQSMLAAAAAATLPTALMADDTPDSGSPNERLGVAVVGVKGRGGSHINFFGSRQDTEILYVCDVDTAIGNSRAEAVAQRQSGRRPQVEQDLRKVLEDPRVDIVSIATPNHWHALASIWSIQAGKDVYVEKPVSHNVWEGRRIVEAARKYKRICQTGTQSRSNPGMIEAIRFVQEGGIGTVKVARGLCYKRRKSIGPKGMYEPPATVDYDLWLGPAPMAPVTRPQFHYDWHWQWAYGNGDLGNQGIHQMDIARWGLNIDRLSDAVFSYGGRLGYEDAGETANTQVVLHDYGDKSLVFEVRGLETGPLKQSRQGVEFDSPDLKPMVAVIFEGTDGYLVVPSYHSGTAFDSEGKVTRQFGGPGSDDLHFANFLQAVRSRKSSDLNADILEGHLSSALCHLGNISYLLGEAVAADEVAGKVSDLPSQDNDPWTLQRVLDHLQQNEVALSSAQLHVGPVLKLDPQSETFGNNSQANALLSREYREPFVVPKDV